jgi:hypothetical protein
VDARLQWLLDDLKLPSGLDVSELDYLVVSGDFTDKGNAAGFEKAYDFLSELTKTFALSAERCILVPGNHDVRDLLDVYDLKKNIDGARDGEWIQKDDIYLVRNNTKYPSRLKPFSDSFYHKFLLRPYPIMFAEQGMAVPFWETGLQFLAFNSCWQIDGFHRKRSAIHVDAVAHAVKQAQQQEVDAKNAGQLPSNKSLLRIGVWHHAVTGRDGMKNTDFLGILEKNGVKLALHGDVHEMVRSQVGYRHPHRIHVVGSGSFGARSADRPESMPRLYNVLEIKRDLRSAIIYTRCQRNPDGPWDGWYEWDDESGRSRVPYYSVTFE